METLKKYYKITAQQEYEKNPKLSHTDVQELLEWSDKNINVCGKLIGECLENQFNLQEIGIYTIIKI